MTRSGLKFRNTDDDVARKVRRSMLSREKVTVDCYASALIFGSTLLFAAVSLLIGGLWALPIAVIGAPLGFGAAFLVAQKGDCLWARTTALIYLGLAFVATGLLLGSGP